MMQIQCSALVSFRNGKPLEFVKRLGKGDGARAFAVRFKDAGANGQVFALREVSRNAKVTLGRNNSSCSKFSSPRRSRSSRPTPTWPRWSATFATIASVTSKLSFCSLV